MLSSLLSTLLLGMSALSLATAAWWSVALARMIATRRKLGTCEQGLALPGVDLPVLVIIPAHNEERVITALVDSLRAQDHPRCRFVLALDRCTDATLAIARERIGADPRFHLYPIDHCPEGWAGKVHAIDAARRAFASSDDELLLFVDADTVLHPSCVRAAAALLVDRRLDMLSLLSTLTFDRRFERRQQGPCVFELMRRYPPALASRDHDRRAFANGQFMLWTWAAYERVGTHSAFRGELLEDLAMARAAWRERLRVHVVPAGEMLRCRMYADQPAFRRGWRRIFTESANRKPARLASWARAAAVRGTIVPIALLLTIVASIAIWIAGLAPVPHAAAACGTSVLALTMWGLGLWIFLTHAGLSPGERLRALASWPAGSLMLHSTLHDAARDLRTQSPTTWAGRTYDRPAR